ncbi:hypothetical protein PROFUN_05078 [Planoprotostelium fungivorum]|uniref:Uncharacterized protein n=1 Tax=Planoprotostelium fungivorum TaxID=1890364 RepID=A0A2P6NSC7_9EUKA|nr:hypothetical protein PROFUN_05078 [Planoprotostelium fungivorum]
MEKTEEKKKKNDGKLRWIVIKQFAKYGIQGVLGAIVAWLLGWYPDVIQQTLDGPRVRKHIEDSPHTDFDRGENFEERDVDKELSDIFGSFDREWGKVIVLIGGSMSGKTWSLKQAASDHDMVIWLNAGNVRNEQDFGKRLYTTLGLWYTPQGENISHNSSLTQTVLSSAFEFFAKQCKIISNSRSDHRVPTLVIEDLNFGSEEQQNLINMVLTESIRLSADKRTCRVILSASDPLTAAADLQRLVIATNKVKIIQMNDFTEEEATRYLSRGSNVLDHERKINWSPSAEHTRDIIRDVGTQVGVLRSIMEDVHQRLESGQDLNASLHSAVNEHVERANTNLDVAISLFPESERALKKLAGRGWGAKMSASEARREFGSAPEDKGQRLYNILLHQKRILAWNASDGSIQISSKANFMAIKNRS